jgi:protein-tyrosine-phosphatase
VNPHAVAAMQEIGIDISHHRSKHVNECFGKAMDTVSVSDGAGDDEESSQDRAANGGNVYGGTDS